jgi:penicillin amidase
MRGRVLALVTALAALVPASASARVIRAESLLPPGQSGYVSIQGVPDGTGSPHLYDQLQPYIDFHWKNALMEQPGATETPRAGVSIVRDSFGIPSVHGDTLDDMWWGAGYAIAQDRMFELELFRRATTGHLSELAGKSRVDDDYVVRRDFYTPTELDRFYSRLSPSFQARFKAYSDGITAWIEHLRSNPLEQPGEYPVTATPLTDWTIRDSVAIGIYLARTIATNADPVGLELANLRAVQLSGSGRILDTLVPLRTPGALTTVPRADGSFPSQPGRTRADERAGFRRSVALAKKLPFPSGAPATPRAVPREARYSLGGPGGSYMFAARRKADGHAFLFNGPQLGFTAPERVVELELHGPGIDVRGMTAPGAPIIGSGFNGHVAFGVTTGASDADDLYAEQLVPGQPEKYMYKGKVRDMACRTETIVYRSPPSDLISKKIPESGSVDRRVCRTVHGPVEARAGNVAYARRYAIWNRELETLDGLAALNEAKSIRDVDRAVRRVTWNENIMAADDQGNIGFWHPGLMPLRPRGYDERLPFPGTGQAEWRGLLSRKRIPAVINPKQGWLANWNNLPANGWTSGDGTARKRLDGSFFRVALLMNQVRAWARKPSFAGMQGVVKRVGTTAQQFFAARTRVRAATRGATGDPRALLTALAAWNGSYAQTDADNTVDPGVAIWDAFRAEAAKIATARFGSAAAWLANEDALHFLTPDYHAGAGYHYFDATHFESYGLRALGPKGYRLAAARAFAALAARFKTTDVTKWREPRRPFDFEGLAAASPPPLPFFDRGTYEGFTELGK